MRPASRSGRPCCGCLRGPSPPFAALREYRPAGPGTEELPVRTARIDSRFEAVLRARLPPRHRVCEFGWVRAPRSHFVVAFSAVEGAGERSERTGWESSDLRGSSCLRGFSRFVWDSSLLFLPSESARKREAEFSISIRFAPDSIRSKRWRRAQRSGRSSVESLELKARWVEIWNL